MCQLPEILLTDLISSEIVLLVIYQAVTFDTGTIQDTLDKLT